MNPKMAEKVTKLAQSLKDNNLVANMEEAIEKAKGMLGVRDGEVPIAEEQEKKEGDLKTVEELFEDEKNAAKAGEELQKDVEEIEKDLEKEKEEEAKEEKELDEVESEIEGEEEKVEEIKESAETIESAPEEAKEEEEKKPE